MKLKNEREIKKLGKDSWDEWKSEDDFELDGDYYQDGYTNGYSQAQQDLLSQASEGFKEWHKDYYKGGSIYEHQQEAWQSAKLSSEAIINTLKQRELGYQDDLRKFKKENEELKEDIKKFLNVREILRSKSVSMRAFAIMDRVFNPIKEKWFKGEANE